MLTWSRSSMSSSMQPTSKVISPAAEDQSAPPSGQHRRERETPNHALFPNKCLRKSSFLSWLIKRIPSIERFLGDSRVCVPAKRGRPRRKSVAEQAHLHRRSPRPTGILRTPQMMRRPRAPAQSIGDGGPPPFDPGDSPRRLITPRYSSRMPRMTPSCSSMLSTTRNCTLARFRLCPKKRVLK